MGTLEPGDWIHGVAYGGLAVTVIAAAWFDARRGIVPKQLTYPSVLVALVLWTIAGLVAGESRQGLVAFGGMLAGLLPFAALVMIGGLGGGDMKLMAAVGAWSASWEVVLSTTVYALLLCVLVALVMMIRFGLVKQTLTRIALMALGSRQPQPIPEEQPAEGRVRGFGTPKNPTIPFASAAAVGALLAGAEQMLGLQTPWAWIGP